MAQHRIVSAEDYRRLVNTARKYRDARERANLEHKSLEELKAYYDMVGAFDKQGDEILVFEVPPETRKEIVDTRLRAEDKANPEALQRFAGSWYFAAYRDLRTTLLSLMAKQQGTMF